MPRYRNRIALNPILRKGGVHERSQSASRRDARHQLDAMVDDWYEADSDDDRIDELGRDDMGCISLILT